MQRQQRCYTLQPVIHQLQQVGFQMDRVRQLVFSNLALSGGRGEREAGRVEARVGHDISDKSHLILQALRPALGDLAMKVDIAFSHLKRKRHTKKWITH